MDTAGYFLPYHFDEIFRNIKSLGIKFEYTLIIILVLEFGIA